MIEWRDVPGYEGFYQASSMGEIRSLPRWIRSSRGDGRSFRSGRILKQRRNKVNGYLNVSLSVRGNITVRYVHRLVAAAFFGEPVGDSNIVRHLDGNPSNNSVENLAWGTYSENALDRGRHGTQYYPSEHRTHCIRGHEFTEENTHYGKRGRSCRACGRWHTANYRARLRDKD